MLFFKDDYLKALPVKPECETVVYLLYSGMKAHSNQVNTLKELLGRLKEYMW